MKRINALFILLIAICFVGNAQQGVNLLPIEQWTLGDGPVGDFAIWGSEWENDRVYLDGPFDNTVLVWKAIADGANAGADGGFGVDLTLDPNKTYRYSAWVRNPNDNLDGRVQLRGQGSALLKMDGNNVGTANIYIQDFPNDDQWYLIVGYIHGQGTTNTAHEGRIYYASGQVYKKVTDYRFKPTTDATVPGQYVLNFRNSLSANKLQYFWNPRVEEVNGNETSIVDMISKAPALRYVKGNWLPSDEWTVGEGSQDEFIAYGNNDPNDPNYPDNIENFRVVGDGPYENNAVLWKTESDGGNNNSGGFYATHKMVDPEKSYRYMVWVKNHTAQDCGLNYFGIKNSSSHQYLNLDGDPVSNPYFWGGELPELDKWYLVVGYVHHADYTGIGTDYRGGVYDIETGERIVEAKDFKFKPNATSSLFRMFHHKCTMSDVGSYFWNPIIEEYDESSKPVSSYFLGKDVLWRPVGTEDAVFKRSGTIGIGLQNDAVLNTDYKLMVDGKIKAREVKVNPDNWADYVFEEGYDLKSLAEVKKYIEEYGHLPDIPSAEAVAEEGLYLGEMDASLLRKIEELTLYLIEKNEMIDFMMKQNSKLIARLKAIEKRVDEIEENQF